MDKWITGIIGIVIFLFFAGGLAKSIGHLPFIIIVIIVGLMAAAAVIQDLRDS
ncbi:MAG: hypothetical protein P8X52_06850 [Limibacillus sp.]|jgi:uncharacterized membrane protein YdcZ (DUF606 family)